jgi:hypothetical protein
VCVAVEAFRHRMEDLGVPRTLVTPHLMGRTIGPVGDRRRQRAVVAAALDLLESATAPGTSVTFDDAGGA